MSEKKAVLSRRNFLAAVGAGGAATAVALVSKKDAAPATSASTDKRATRGYQVTEHVNNYYRTTKV